MTHSELLLLAAGLDNGQRLGGITAGDARDLVAVMERVLDQRDDLRKRLRAATDDVARLSDAPGPREVAVLRDMAAAPPVEGRDFTLLRASPPLAAEPRRTVRPEVLAFARVMSAKIDGHNHDRGEHGWRTATPIDLLDWLHRYFADLQDAARAFAFRGETDARGRVLSKAANVANLAMMIADVCGAIPAQPLAAEGTATPDLAEVERLVDVLMASVELDGFHGDPEDEPAACRAALLSAVRALAGARGDAPEPYYLADGTSVLLPKEEVERRRRAAALALKKGDALSGAIDRYMHASGRRGDPAAEEVKQAAVAFDVALINVTVGLPSRPAPASRGTPPEAKP
jgi:hypothetical protein